MSDEGADRFVGFPGFWRRGDADETALIARADGPFKTALDRYNYASRYDDVDASAERSTASLFLADLDDRLAKTGWLMDD